MSDFQAIMNSLANPTGIQAVIVLALAVISCFFGYKAFRPLVAIACFLIGLALGLGYAAKFVSSDAYCWAIGLIFGLFLAFVGYKASYLGLAIWVGYAAYGPLSSLFANKQTGMIVGIIVAVLTALLVWKLKRPLIILATGITGASQIFASATGILKVSAGAQPWLWLAGFLVLAAIGIIVQFRTTAKAG